MSPVTLAFLGDAVFGLMVRAYLIKKGVTHAGRLHRQAVSYVCAGAQAQAMTRLMPVLTPEEQAIFRRGRNANTTHVPKNANALDYRRATGLEALFGFLYLNGQFDRLQEIFDAVVEESADGGKS